MGRFLEVFDNALRQCPSPTVPPGVQNRPARYARSDESAKPSGISMDAAHADPPAPTVTPDSRHPLIEPAVRAKLEAIEAGARRLGWPAELLWNGNFWDCPRGLAAVLDPGDEIIEVTTDHISILKVKRDLLNFRRHAA